MELDYFYGSESEQFVFYRIPKILITSPKFKDVSDSAKLLYGLMLDRMGLSLRNGWVDEHNRAFIYFTVKDVTEQMCCSIGKAVKLMAELDSIKGIGLIERVKSGQGKPARIYLKKFTDSKAESQDLQKSENKTDKNCNSRVSKTESQDLQKAECNYNNINNTESNNIELNHINHINQKERWIDRYNKNMDLIKRNIEYDSLATIHDKSILDNIVNVMAEVLTVDKHSYIIEGCEYPAELIRKRFKEVDYGVIDTFLLHFERSTDKIRNIKAYVITSMFNAPATVSVQLHNTVANDLYGRRDC